MQFIPIVLKLPGSATCGLYTATCTSCTAWCCVKMWAATSSATASMRSLDGPSTFSRMCLAPTQYSCQPHARLAVAPTQMKTEDGRKRMAKDMQTVTHWLLLYSACSAIKAVPPPHSRLCLLANARDTTLHFSWNVHLSGYQRMLGQAKRKEPLEEHGGAKDWIVLERSSRIHNPSGVGNPGKSRIIHSFSGVNPQRYGCVPPFQKRNAYRATKKFHNASSTKHWPCSSSPAAHARFAPLPKLRVKQGPLQSVNNVPIVYATHVPVHTVLGIQCRSI